MRKAFKKIAALLLAMLLVVGIAASTSSKVCAADATSEVRESIVVVYTCIELKNGKEIQFGWGTGFFVGDPEENPEYLITNHHVIEEYLGAGKGELYEYQYAKGKVSPGRAKIRVFFDSNDFVEAYVVDADSAKDIALLKLDAPTDKRKALPLKIPTEDMVGTTIYCAGYPGLSENIFEDATSSWGKNDASITSGTISRFVTRSGTGARRIQTDAAIMSGHSGGPMVNSDCQVVGINVSVTYSKSDQGADEAMYYAVNVDEIIPMLKLHDVNYVMADSGKSFPLLPVIIGIVAAVIVIAVIVILIICKKGKKNKVQAPVNAAPVANKVPAVRSLAAQHNMARYPITSGRIIIGRDPQSCTVVFSKNTPGISGRHCEVMWDGGTGDFILTDLNSTYGTFLSNGQKLEPNATYRLKPGESFYLAEGANTIRVELE